MTPKQAINFARMVAKTLGVFRKIKKLEFKNCRHGWCDDVTGALTYPAYIFHTSDAYIKHFLIHEVAHLKCPAEMHGKEFLKWEVRMNKRFGLRVIYSGIYAASLYDLNGNLLYKQAWADRIATAKGESARKVLALKYTKILQKLQKVVRN